MSDDRLHYGMSAQEMAIALAGGNPGARNTCVSIMKYAKIIDPDMEMEYLGYLMILDSHKIYNEKIYTIWSDICKKNIVHTLAVIRALHSRIISEETFTTALNNYGNGIVCEEVLKQVQEKFPRFGKIILVE